MAAVRSRWLARVNVWAEVLGSACSLLIGWVPEDARLEAEPAGLCACPTCIRLLVRQIERARPDPPR